MNEPKSIRDQVLEVEPETVAEAVTIIRETIANDAAKEMPKSVVGLAFTSSEKAAIRARHEAEQKAFLADLDQQKQALMLAHVSSMTSPKIGQVTITARPHVQEQKRGRKSVWENLERVLSDLPEDGALTIQCDNTAEFDRVKASMRQYARGMDFINRLVTVQDQQGNLVAYLIPKTE